MHIHSIHSDDGEFAPARLVAMAKDAGLGVMAVADHNHATGVEEALRAGRDLDVEVVPAIEIDCRHEGIGLHILAYFVDHTDQRFARLAEQVDVWGRESGQRRLELIRGLGIRIDEQRLRRMWRNGQITGELLGEIALDDSANDGNPLLEPYRQGGKRSDNPYLNFHFDFCATGRPAHVHVEYMSLQAALELVRATGGVPALAHPGISLRGRETLLADIEAIGVRGVEAYSSYHSPEQSMYWRAEAERLGMFVTCGSDFHGKTKPKVFLGVHGCDDGEAIWEALRKAAGR